ncbi:hypothetical protein [Candidatus Williamhamiltonella defendens]|nr:hypothetical protein [Candidatus Hamiltonella defensa]
MISPDLIIINIKSSQAAEEAKYHEKLLVLGILIVYVDFRHYLV